MKSTCPKRLAEMYAAYQTMSLAEVGKRFGVTRQCVHTIFNRNCLKMRGKIDKLAQDCLAEQKRTNTARAQVASWVKEANECKQHCIDKIRNSANNPKNNFPAQYKAGMLNAASILAFEEPGRLGDGTICEESGDYTQ